MKEVRADNFVKGFVFPLIAFDEIVEVVDIGLMMFAVVIVKSLYRDLVGELIFGVGEFREDK